MAINRQAFPVPPKGVPILGMNDIDLLTSKQFWQGMMRRCVNYHLGVNGVTKRMGHQLYQAIGGIYVGGTGTTPVQSYAAWDWAGTRYLVAVCGGKLYYWNGSTWADISGALTLNSGANSRFRWTMFHNGSTAYLCGSDGTNALFKWDGTSSPAVVLGGTPPTKAMGLSEFNGSLFVLNTDGGPTATEYSDSGVVDTWSSGQLFHCFRQSEGMGLIKHTDDLLLVFHRQSWAKNYFKYVDTGLVDSYYAQDPGGQNGLVSPDALVNYLGRTYYASDEGIFEIYSASDGTLQERHISRPISGTWRGLQLARKQYITCFAGGPWQEVVFLVSEVDTDECDAALVYNPAIAQYHANAGWTVFEGTGGKQKFNCGIVYRDSSERRLVLVGGYDGATYEAWGTDQYPTSYTDRTSPITSTLQTGYIDCGLEAWIKGLRAIQCDLLVNEDRNFNFLIYGSNYGISMASTSEAVGGGGDMIGVDFVFDESYFAVEGVQDFETNAIDQSARFFQVQISESSTGTPHSFSGLRFMFTPERKAIY